MLPTDVFTILNTLPVFKKVPRKRLRTFSLEISLVAVGLRSGYLFDSFSIPGDRHQVFCDTVSSLREEISVFKQVVVIYAQDSDDVFFINGSLVLEKCPDTSEASACAVPVSPQNEPTFVVVSPTGPVITRSVPPRLAHLLADLHSRLALGSPGRFPASITIPAADDVSVADIIPLAAVLIDYPIAYVPHSADQTSFLSGVELEVFSCTLVSDTPTLGRDTVLPVRHTFMQFSCPRSLLPGMGSIPDALKEKFTGRLARTRLPYRLEVTSRTECLDRVAL